MPVLLIYKYYSHTAYNIIYKIIQFVLNILFIFPAFNALIDIHLFKNMDLKLQ